MKPDRLNALTDGIVAVAITLTVLAIKAPEGATLAALRPWMPLLGVYALSFVNVGIYWNNHHHMMQSAPVIDGRVLWANLMFLFFLSLTPIVIRWIDEQGIRALPIASYGLIMVGAGLTYSLLEYTLELAEGSESIVRRLLGSRVKEWISLAGYTVGIGASLLSPLLSIGIYLVVTGLWLIPDSRFERQLPES